MDNKLPRQRLRLHSRLARSRYLRISGSRYEVGYRHGVAHRSRIDRFLGDRLTRIGAVLGKPVGLPDFGRTIGEYAAVIETSLPDLAEELYGLAEGAGITMETAYFLQLRRELVGYQSVKPHGDCTVFGRLSPNRAILGQTIDLNGDMAPELTVMQLDLEDNDRRIMLVSFTGLLGLCSRVVEGLFFQFSLGLA